MTEIELEKEENIADIVNMKMDDAELGINVEFSPEEAEFAGALEDDAIGEDESFKLSSVKA